MSNNEAKNDVLKEINSPKSARTPYSSITWGNPNNDQREDSRKNKKWSFKKVGDKPYNLKNKLYIETHHRFNQAPEDLFRDEMSGRLHSTLEDCLACIYTEKFFTYVSAIDSVIKKDVLCQNH